MSTSREALEAIIATIPAFRPRWHKFLEDWQGEETPWYLAMGEIAHYVVDEYENGNRGQFKSLFSAVELGPQSSPTVRVRLQVNGPRNIAPDSIPRLVAGHTIRVCQLNQFLGESLAAKIAAMRD